MYRISNSVCITWSYVSSRMPYSIEQVNRRIMTHKRSPRFLFIATFFIWMHFLREWAREIEHEEENKFLSNESLISEDLHWLLLCCDLFFQFFLNKLFLRPMKILRLKIVQKYILTYLLLSNIFPSFNQLQHQYCFPLLAFCLWNYTRIHLIKERNSDYIIFDFQGTQTNPIPYLN